MDFNRWWRRAAPAAWTTATEASDDGIVDGTDTDETTLRLLHDEDGVFVDSSTQECWSTTYTAIKKNDDATFLAKGQ